MAFFQARPIRLLARGFPGFSCPAAAVIMPEFGGNSFASSY
jgi:hypothetical protein